MGTFSIWHWIVVLIVVVLVFGTKKLRNLGSDLGSAVKGFKEGMKDAHSEGSTTQTSNPSSLTFDNDTTENTFKKENDTVKTTYNTPNENELKPDSDNQTTGSTAQDNSQPKT